MNDNHLPSHPAHGFMASGMNPGDTPGGEGPGSSVDIRLGQ